MTIGEIIIVIFGILIVIFDLARGDSSIPGIKKALAVIERRLPNITTFISLSIIVVFVIYQLNLFGLNPQTLTPPFLLIIVLLLIFQIRTMIALVPSLSRITIVENNSQADKILLQALGEGKYDKAIVIGYTCAAHEADFWKGLIESCRDIEIIFQDPGSYIGDEIDYHISHKNRFLKVLDDLALIVYDLKNEGASIPKIKYVTTKQPTTLRAVLIEGRICSLGWLTYFAEHGLNRIRGHSNPVVIVAGIFLPLASRFIKEHHNRVWDEPSAVSLLANTNIAGLDGS